MAKHKATIQVEWLPSYAPQLNPAEGVWSWSKSGDLKNHAPHDVYQLRDTSMVLLSAVANDRGCFDRSSISPSWLSDRSKEVYAIGSIVLKLVRKMSINVAFYKQ